MAAAMRQIDPTRPIHNEGSVKMHWNQGHNSFGAGGERATDFIAPMYPHVDHIIQWAKTATGDRPFIMCEYSHAMGNSNGGLKEYWDAIYTHYGLQGGFIWDWIEQGITKESRSRRPVPIGHAGPRDDTECHRPGGDRYWAYGGDFGDQPNDVNFCCNGMINPDRTPKPSMWEFKKLVQPIRMKAVDIDRGIISIENDDWFQDMAWLEGDWYVEVDGTTVQKGKLPSLGLKPQTNKDIRIPITARPIRTGQEVFLTIRFRTRNKQMWGPKGHTVAWEQFALPWEAGSSLPAVPAGKAPLSLRQTRTRATITDPASGFRLVVDTVKGGIKNAAIGSTPLLLRGPEFNVWRGPLDNDGVKGKSEQWHAEWKPLGRWVTAGLNTLNPILQSVKVTPATDGSIHVDIRHRYTCRGSKKGFLHKQSYSIRPGGVILADHHFVMDKGIVDPPRLGVRMVLPNDLEQLTWLGHGPHESYADRKAGAPVGRYHGTVAEQYVPYIVPQEHGNKEAVRWFSLCNADGVGVQVQAEGPLSFSASHLTPEDLTRAFHTNELKPRDEICVLMDAVQRGIGTASCGPDIWEQYRIRSGSYHLRYAMIPLNGKKRPARMALPLRA